MIDQALVMDMSQQLSIITQSSNCSMNTSLNTVDGREVKEHSLLGDQPMGLDLIITFVAMNT